MNHTFDVIVTLVEKELKAKYKNTSLGFVWSVFQPLFMASIFYFAFKVIMRIQIENYAFYVISGLFVWQWITIAVQNSQVVYLGNRAIVKKIALERMLLPLSVVVTEMFHFMLSIGVIILFMFVYDVRFSFNWLLLPVALILQGMWIYGVALVVSIANTFFRDVERIIAFVLQLLFYASPIIYGIGNIPQEYRKWLEFNPLFPMIETWHSIFIGTPLNWYYLGLFALSSVLFLTFGLWINRKFINKIAEVL